MTADAQALAPSARDDIEAAKLAVDAKHPGPSRAKALVHTKLDEALLWLSQVEEGK